MVFGGRKQSFWTLSFLNWQRAKVLLKLEFDTEDQVLLSLKLQKYIEWTNLFVAYPVMAPINPLSNLEIEIRYIKQLHYREYFQHPTVV